MYMYIHGYEKRLENRVREVRKQRKAGSRTEEGMGVGLRSVSVRPGLR